MWTGRHLWVPDLILSRLMITDVTTRSVVVVPNVVEAEGLGSAVACARVVLHSDCTPDLQTEKASPVLHGSRSASWPMRKRRTLSARRRFQHKQKEERGKGQSPSCNDPGPRMEGESARSVPQTFQLHIRARFGGGQGEGVLFTTSLVESGPCLRNPVTVPQSFAHRHHIQTARRYQASLLPSWQLSRTDRGKGASGARCRPVGCAWALLEAKPSVLFVLQKSEDAFTS